MDERAQDASDGDVPDAETGPAVPAPAWWPVDKPHLRCCEGFHDTDPDVADRICFGPGWEVPTSLPLVDKSDEDSSFFRLGVSQHVDDDKSKIWLGVGDHRHGRHLTASEASNLAAVLWEAAENAEAFT
ncbi:hypothetical protein [Streptomyces sp. NPDC020747]|uniref:hypothetical protein n=1 Tax=Streptomyces sp. NPDC020747 TaxID=3365086 RepID=UPI00378DD2E8